MLRVVPPSAGAYQLAGQQLSGLSGARGSSSKCPPSGENEPHVHQTLLNRLMPIYGTSTSRTQRNLVTAEAGGAHRLLQETRVSTEGPEPTSSGGESLESFGFSWVFADSNSLPRFTKPPKGPRDRPPGRLLSLVTHLLRQPQWVVSSIVRHSNDDLRRSLPELSWGIWRVTCALPGVVAALPSYGLRPVRREHPAPSPLAATLLRAHPYHPIVKVRKWAQETTDTAPEDSQSPGLPPPSGAHGGSPSSHCSQWGRSRGLPRLGVCTPKALRAGQVVDRALHVMCITEGKAVDWWL